MVKSEHNRTLYSLLAFSLIVGSSIGYSSIYLFHVVATVSILLFFMKVCADNPAISFPRIYLYFILFFFFNLISLAWTINITFTLYQSFYLFVGIAIVYFVNNLLESKDERLFTFPIVLGLLIGVLESLGIARWPWSPYSEYVTLFGRGFKGVGLNQPIKIPTVFFGNPNGLSLALNYLLAFTLFMKNKFHKIIVASVILLLITFTDSRGGQIVSLFLIFTYLLFFFPQLRLFIKLIFPTTILTLVIIMRKIFEKFDIFYLLDFSNVGRGSSIGIRQQIILNNLHFLRENPFHLFFGVGGGASKEINAIYGNTHGILNNHFFMLELLSEYGIIVFTFIMTVYVVSLVKMYRISRVGNEDSKYAKPTFLALLITIPGSISTSTIIYFFPFWIILGFTIYHLKHYRRLV